MPRRRNGIGQSTPASKERQRRAVELRGQGWTFQAIADELGFRDQSGAYRCYTRALQQIPAPAVHQLRDQMREDLQQIRRALWPKVMSGDVWAVQRVLDAMERTAKLFGLDAPNRKQVEVISQSLVDAEIAKLEKELASHDRA